MPANGMTMPPQKPTRYHVAMPARQRIDGGPRPHVRSPGEQEDEPRVQHPAPGQECAEGDRDVRGNWRKDVFDGGQHGDQRVQRNRREVFEKREEVGQVSDSPPLERGPAGSASVATAITAIPSPRPIQPIPSFVFAFTDTCAGPVSNASARRSFIASICGASFGFSMMTVTSACTNWNPASTTLRNALLSKSIELASFQRGSSLGNMRPMSPRPAAPRMASVTAWATASASE